MRGKLIAVCRQIVEVTYNYAPREADPQRQRKLPTSSRRVSNCRGARSHEHLDSLERVAGRLTRVLGDEGDDANRTIYRWPVRLHRSGGAHTPSNGSKSLPEREMEGR